MSKIAAYIGSSLALEGFFTRPEQGLFHLATAPSNEDELGYVAGGFGLGWYNPGPNTATYINPLPCWKDPNLPGLLKSIRRRMWMGYLHGSDRNYSPCVENMQPLHQDDILFIHEGEIEDFLTTLRPYCLRYLAPEIEAGISGQTASEYLFALLRQRMTEEDHVSAKVALAEIAATLEVTLRDIKAGLNFIISDGLRLYAIRHSTNQPCTPLFYSEDDPSFPSGSQLVASAPLSSEGKWEEVPEHHMLILDPSHAPELVRL